MASLIFEHDGRRCGAALKGRIIIGRRANSHISIPDRTVSRIHAWIGEIGAKYFIADTGSRTGTKVNGQWTRGRRILHDGDQIQIGGVRLEFNANGKLPPGVEAIDVYEPRLDEEEDGIFLDCACGAPIWARWECGGKVGRCRDCGQLIALPVREGGPISTDTSSETMAPGMSANLSQRQAAGVHFTSIGPSAVESAFPFLDAGEASHQAEHEPAPETICGACQSAISLLEPTTACPECGVCFHADCWIENHGCSSYGCTQVGILEPKPDEPPEVLSIPQVGAEEKQELLQAAPPEHDHVLWTYLLLAASVFLALAGALEFGLPSLLLGIVVAVGSVRRPTSDRKLFALVLVVSMVAAAAGAAISTFWWFGPSAVKIGRP